MNSTTVKRICQKFCCACSSTNENNSIAFYSELRLPVPSELSDALQSIVKQCLNIEHKERPSFAQIRTLFRTVTAIENANWNEAKREWRQRKFNYLNENNPTSRHHALATAIESRPAVNEREPQ